MNVQKLAREIMEVVLTFDYNSDMSRMGSIGSTSIEQLRKDRNVQLLNVLLAETGDHATEEDAKVVREWIDQARAQSNATGREIK